MPSEQACPDQVVRVILCTFIFFKDLSGGRACGMPIGDTGWRHVCWIVGYENVLSKVEKGGIPRPPDQSGTLYSTDPFNSVVDPACVLGRATYQNI